MADIIIVEGSDCAGKTTLINRLKDSLNYQVVKGSSFEQSTCTNEELFNKFDEMTKLEKTVLDRFIYSNLVYAPLYKDFALLTDDQCRLIESKMKDKAIIIYLEAEMDTLIHRLKTRGDDYVTIDKLEGIKESYNRLIPQVELKVLRFNTSFMTTNEIIDEVMETIK